VTAPSGWPPTVPAQAPDTGLLPFDASKPNIARAYDYLLGGKDNFAADRELAEKILAIYPGTRQMAHRPVRGPGRRAAHQPGRTRDRPAV